MGSGGSGITTACSLVNIGGGAIDQQVSTLVDGHNYSYTSIALERLATTLLERAIMIMTMMIMSFKRRVKINGWNVRKFVSSFLLLFY